MHIRRSPALALATGAPTDRRSKIGLRLISVCCYRCRDPHADQKTMFGAILMTGFLGGAICTHFHVGEIATTPQLVSLLLGGSAWGALYLRDLRVRTLLPLVD